MAAQHREFVVQVSGVLQQKWTMRLRKKLVGTKDTICVQTFFVFT